MTQTHPEGGLDVAGNLDVMKAACERLAAADIQVSLFIDADKTQIGELSGLSKLERLKKIYADKINTITKSLNVS